MTQGNVTTANAIAPRRLAYFSSPKAALELAESLRWQGEKYCPRCRSLLVKDINSSVFRRLFRCVDCGYIFNSLAGTIFQGTKLPIGKFYQAFVLADALGDTLTAKDLALALDVSPRTGAILLDRLARVEGGVTFTIVDPEVDQAEESAAITALSGDTTDEEPFFAFCRQRHILVSDRLFRDRLAHILTECFGQAEDHDARQSRA